ncbi:MAG: class I SAM-dependent methyltransferase [Bacillota bacterium]
MQERSHNPNRWHEKLLQYYPINFNPNTYFFEQGFADLINIIVSLGKSFLEVGAHTGLACICIKLKYPEAHIVASDINEKVCDLIRSRIFFAKAAFGMGDIEVKNIDLFNIPYPDNAFDVIFSSGVMEHYSEDEILKGIKEQLRCAEYVVVDVPAEESRPPICVGGYGDEHYYSVDEWICMVKKVGKLHRCFERRNSKGAFHWCFVVQKERKK